MSTADATAPNIEQARPPLLKRRKFWIWVIVILAFLALVNLGVRGVITAMSLQKVVPLASSLQSRITDGDTDGAAQIAAEIQDHTGTARSAAGGLTWSAAELIPVVGNNLTAVRQAAIAADDLATGALEPASQIDLGALEPVDGAFNLEGIASLVTPVTTAADAVESADLRLQLVDRAFLLPPVGNALDELTSKLDEVAPALYVARDVLPVLPDALGANGARNYIFVFPNNAEVRSLGGNPASISYMTADAGRLEITQQAASTDFQNNRETPVTALPEPAAALYGDKIGRFIQDTLMQVNFDDAANVIEAYWAEQFGTPVDGVLSFDPVALSYLLEGTGPVTTATGDTLTADNAVNLLLHDIYYRYPNASGADLAAQDAFFNASSAAVFQALTSGQGNPTEMVAALGQASEEGRLMFHSNHGDIQSIVAGTRLQGPFGDTDRSNEKVTAVGVFLNDNTEGKLDYYDRLSITASSDQCTSSTPTFTVTADFEYTLPAADVAGLPTYISTGRYFPKGDKSTNFVFYGPVGSEYTGTTLDGEPYEFAHTLVIDQGRPAIRIQADNAPETGHVFEVHFTGAESVYGPLEVRHTPLTSEVPVEIDTPGC